MECWVPAQFTARYPHRPLSEGLCIDLLVNSYFCISLPVNLGKYIDEAAVIVDVLVPVILEYTHLKHTLLHS